MSVANIYSFSHTSNQQIFIEPLQCAKSYARCLGYSSFLPSWSLKLVRDIDKYISQFSALMILSNKQILSGLQKQTFVLLPMGQLQHSR